MRDYSARWSKLINLHWLVYVLFVLALISSGVHFLRQNNLQMGQLKAQVIAADEAGEPTQELLQELGSYVFNHMNTSTEVTLAAQYSRDAQAAIAANRPQDSNDQRIYDDAIRECENPNIPLTARANCVAEYVSANSPDIEQAEIELPAEQQYTYSFVAPLWSADLAGFSFLGAAMFAGLAVRAWLKSVAN